MKTNYNKSEIMTMAWRMFKSNICTFSEALKLAWAEVKRVSNIVVNNVKEAFEAVTKFNYRAGMRSEISDSIISLVAEKGNGVAQKIAESFKYNEKELSTKQAWCVAYEYMRIK